MFHSFLQSPLQVFSFLLSPFFFLGWRIRISPSIKDAGIRYSGLITLFVMLFYSFLIIPTAVIEFFDRNWGLSFYFHRPLHWNPQNPFLKETSTQSLLFCLLCWDCFSPIVLFCVGFFLLFISYIITEFHLPFYCSSTQYCEILLRIFIAGFCFHHSEYLTAISKLCHLSFLLSRLLMNKLNNTKHRGNSKWTLLSIVEMGRFFP